MNRTELHHYGKWAPKTFMVKCCKEQHTIFVSSKGRVVFNDHEHMSLKALTVESGMKNDKAKGCYFFAFELLSLSQADDYGSKGYGSKRRNGRQVALVKAGLPEEVGLYFKRAATIANNGCLDESEQTYKAVLNSRKNRHAFTLEYGEPLYKNVGHRIKIVQDLLCMNLRSKADRVGKRLIEKGLAPEYSGTYY